jgi:hypothetical protein
MACVTTIHPRPSRPAVLVAIGALAVLLAACGGAASTALPIQSSSCCTEPPTSTPAEPTEVPGGASVTPAPLPDDVSTTETAWGTILDVVPTTFPVFPGAEPGESPDEPVSGAWISSAGVDDVAAWYRDELEGLGYRTAGLSEPLEDGSRVLDSVADIPECRIQAAFRPAGESTMITVLYAAGCAGGEG